MSTPIKTMTGQEIKILRSWLHHRTGLPINRARGGSNPYLGTSKKGKKTT